MTISISTDRRAVVALRCAQRRMRVCTAFAALFAACMLALLGMLVAQGQRERRVGASPGAATQRHLRV